MTTLLVITAPHLGQLLLNARKRKKLTQKEVGIRVGVSQNRLSHLENNPEEISFQQLLSWTAAVGLELRVGEKGIEKVAEW
jgi:HTH-type transcriptional regulator / antitoxin HipB